MIDLFEVPFTTPGRLAIALRPRGDDWLDDELQDLAGRGWSVLVSMLTDDENRELGLVDEAAAARRCGIELHRLATADRQPLSASAAAALVTVLLAHLEQGRSVAVHCRQGIGRSSSLVGAVLVTAGATATDAWTTLTTARGRRVPDTDEQAAWLDAFAALTRRR